MLSPALVYVIGYPGSGKTTAMRSVVDGLASRVEEKPFKHTIYDGGTVQLGYEREAHGGTDGLSFNVQPTGGGVDCVTAHDEAWLNISPNLGKKHNDEGG